MYIFELEEEKANAPGLEGGWSRGMTRIRQWRRIGGTAAAQRRRNGGAVAVAERMRGGEDARIMTEAGSVVVRVAVTSRRVARAGKGVAGGFAPGPGLGQR